MLPSLTAKYSPYSPISSAAPGPVPFIISSSTAYLELSQIVSVKELQANNIHGSYKLVEETLSIVANLFSNYTRSKMESVENGPCISDGTITQSLSIILACLGSSDFDSTCEWRGVRERVTEALKVFISFI
jgi:hypothetical protein